MTTEPTLQAWHDFFVAQAGASAALSGLLFVAISINLARVLEFKSLPARAAEAFLSLLSVLVISTFALIPGQSLRACGVELAVSGTLLWLLQTISMVSVWKIAHPQAKSVLRVIANQLPPLPFVAAGVLLLLGHSNGLYWTVPGVLMSFTAGLFGAWILLIEILR